MEQKRFPNAAAIVAIAAAACATAAVSLASLNTLKDAAIEASLRGRPVGLGLVRSALGPLDVMLVLTAGVTVLGLVWLEWRQRAFSRLVAGMTPAEGWVLAAILVAWLGHAYLSPGVLLGGDISTHISRFVEVARGLDEGRLAAWTNYQYMGAPLLWFTGPLTYVVGGALTWLLRDAVLVMKLLLFLAHVLGGLAFYGMLRRMAFRPLPALLAAAGFAGSFAHLHMFLVRGVMPQAFTMVFMVMLFWAADGLMRQVGARWLNALTFGLATAALIVNHQPHALFIALYLALFGAVAVGSGVWRLAGAPVLVAAGVLGAVASMVAVAPILLEADGTMIEPEGAMFALQVPGVQRLLNLVVWRNGGTVWGADYWAYLGVALLGFGGAGIVGLALGRLAPGRRGLAAAALACLALEFFMYNTVVRDVMFMLFFLGLLAAVGVERLAGTTLRGRWLMAAAGVALLDLASTSVQPVLRTDKGFLLEAGRYLERTSPNQRVMQVGALPGLPLNVDMGPDGTPLDYAATIQRVAGNHNMAATRVHNFLGATAKLVQAELEASGTISSPLRALLGVFNVSRLICNDSVANGCPANRIHGTQPDPVLGPYLPIPAAPVIFSRRLVEQMLPPEVDKPMLWPVYYTWPWEFQRIRNIEDAVRRFVETERPDIETRIAAVIPVQQAVPAGPAPEGEWHPALRAYAVSLDRVMVRIEADGPGWVQLSHPWFPSTIVTVNGQPVRPLRGTIGLMVLPVEPGVSVIALREGSTTARWVSGLVSLAGLLALLAWAAVLRRRDRALQPV